MSNAAIRSTDAALAQSDRRTLGPWFAAEFLNSYAVNLYLIGCYDFADKELRASPSQRLGLSAIWGFAYIFISLLAGRNTEWFGPRKAAIGGSACAGVGAMVGLFAIRFPSLWMLALVMFPFNFSCTQIWPAIESGLTRTPGNMRLSSRIALFNLSWGSAGFVAIFTHGIFEQAAWWSIFVVPAAAHLTASLILLVKGVPANMIGSHNVPDDAEGEHELDDPVMRARAQLFLKLAWIANALAYTAIYVLLPTMTQLAFMAFPQADLRVAGIITSIWFVMRFTGFAITSKWTGWHYKTVWLLCPLIALAASFCGLLTIHHPVALLGLQIIFGFSAALVFSGSLYYAMHVSSGHGGHAAFHEAVVGIGTTAGPLIGALAGSGELGQQAMHRIALSVTAVLALGIAVIAGMTWNMRSKGTLQ